MDSSGYLPSIAASTSRALIVMEMANVEKSISSLGPSVIPGSTLESASSKKLIPAQLVV